MSEYDNQPLHKYKVGDTYMCGGIEIKIVELLDSEFKGQPMYMTQIGNNKPLQTTEGHIDICMGRKYGVSFIASAPDELKVWDRVEVVDEANGLYRKQGIVQTVPVDGRVWVEFANNASYCVRTDQLRKLPETSNPLDKQVGGSHYKNMAIQPVEFCMKNNLDFCTSSAIKYLCRHKNKNGKEDLLKAKHFIDLLIQMEYPED